MPVYDRRYRGWDGERRPSRWLFLSLTRFGIAEVFSSKLLLVLFVASCLPFLVFGSGIYLLNNADFLKLVQGDVSQLAEWLGGRLFFWFLVTQALLAFVVVSFTGPNLVGPDLVHGAMPLYLSRPISRADYVLGKLAVLLALLSAITWLPGLLLAGLQASLAPEGWLAAHWQIPVGLFLGSWIWILVLSLLALAISAWIRWRPLATSALFIVIVVGAAFGTAIDEMLDTRWGKLLNLTEMTSTIWIALFGDAVKVVDDEALPLAACWLGLAAACAVALAILHRKIRAYEVVR